MSTKPETIEHLKAQLTGASPFRIQAMFGEYALYVDEKLVALICDDRLFVKKTSFGDAELGEGYDAPPYPGAKPSLLIPEEKVADPAWLCEFVRKTAEQLPAPKPKAAKRR
jgi:TfoX/Sxy family transcriptional regulator of competence genes